ncbi:MAG TPA: DUF5682 family protein [Chloroflexia bacterium]|nr:DUF5682 family protein [Chloroflexia bacterium]
MRQALQTLRPDCILVEGPPDAAAVLPLLTHAAMRPPVALLVYVPNEPQRAVYYPFAIFSPEWQALHYGLTHTIPVRFMDLPQAHRLALAPPEPAAPAAEPGPPPAGEPPASPAGAPAAEPAPSPHDDPLGWLAQAAGYSDGERWWDHMVESRRDGVDLFAAVLEAMSALREGLPPPTDPVEALREAYMRQTIRAAQAEGCCRIAVVCGAFHAPVLAAMPADAAADAALLRDLPKVPTQATWVPWTHGRLSYHSGYGAGIESPGWYAHLWTMSAAGHSPTEVAAHWLTRVARLLRDEDLDASPAHVIEAVRLAHDLAVLRDRPVPGLPEMNEATEAVLCAGNDLPLRLIHEKLIVGEILGRVPETTPMVPLAADLQREQRRLRLPAEALQRDYDLDLRKPGDLDRSHLLHRLNLLSIPWGKLQRVAGKKGTFHELWKVQWQPELAVALIEAGIWGNTILDAATAYTRTAAEQAPDLPALTRLVDGALLADLPGALEHLLARLQAEAARASDVAHLMDALPPLAQVMRYGNVRQTDATQVGQVVDGLVARICIGLPGASASLNDEAAEEMFKRLLAVDGAVALLEHAAHLAAWQGVLHHLADQQGLHGLIAGRCCRILLEAGAFTPEDTARRLGLALSLAGDPTAAATWVEGFLKGSGLLLLHDEALWAVLDAWVAALAGDTFTALLPLLRRTFSTFPAPERRAMGERVRQGPARPAPAAGDLPADFDSARAVRVLPLVARLLGVAVPDLEV